MIDAGGDVLLRGGPWRVGVRHPLRGDALCAALELSDAAVATSGAYERGDHVLDPVRRRAGARRAVGHGRGALAGDAPTPTRPPRSPWVGAGPAWTARLRGCEAMTVLEGGEVLCTEGFARHRLALSGAA